MIKTTNYTKTSDHSLHGKIISETDDNTGVDSEEAVFVEDILAVARERGILLGNDDKIGNYILCNTKTTTLLKTKGYLTG